MDECEDRDYNGVPFLVCRFTDRVLTDLDENITKLMLRYNDEPPVPRGPLKYTNLVALLVISLKLSLPPDFFSMLHNLQNLSLHNVIFDGMPPELPTSVTTLSIFQTISKNPLNMSKLYNLTFFYAVNNELTELPSLANTAPLKILDLRGNFLTNLMLQDIAQYCQLTNVDLSYTNIQNGSNEAYCELAAWFESHNISYVLRTKKSPLFTKNAKECSGTIIPQNAIAEMKYNKCLNRGGWISPLLIVASVLTLSLCIAIGLAYYFWRKRVVVLNSASVPSTDNKNDPKVGKNPKTGANT